MKKNYLFIALAAMVFTAAALTGCKKDDPEPVKVSSVAFKTTPSALAVGGEFTFEVTVLPENAENKSVTWDSSDKTVATVTAGVVKALAAGKTTVSATAADGSGKKAEFEVTVNAPEVVSSVTVEGDGFDIDERMTILASAQTTTPVVVNIASARGIEKLLVKIDTSNEAFGEALAGMGLVGEFDLANPGELGAVFSNPAINLPNGDAVKGKTTLPFDITGFVPLMFGFTDSEMTADFKLTVVDDKAVSETKTLQLDLTDNTKLWNSGFEYWSPVPYGTTAGNDIWYPSATVTKGEDLRTIAGYWDTANEGLSMLGPKNITMYDETDLRPGTTGKRSVKMQSTKFMGRFATGNIYTGDFGAITTTPLGANVYFGRPFAVRPSALKGWYKAAPGTVTDSSYPAKPVGAPDEYQIYIMLTDWTEPREVNTAIPETLIDFEADYVIGLGQISDIEGLDPTKPVTDWTEFNIPIEYRSDKTPTYIVVVACASKYGDYLTGSTDSVLQIDDFELVYE